MDAVTARDLLVGSECEEPASERPPGHGTEYDREAERVDECTTTEHASRDDRADHVHEHVRVVAVHVWIEQPGDCRRNESDRGTDSSGPLSSERTRAFEGSPPEDGAGDERSDHRRTHERGVQGDTGIRHVDPDDERERDGTEGGTCRRRPPEYPVTFGLHDPKFHRGSEEPF